MEPDYQILGHESIDRAADLAEFLRAHDGTPLRVLGLGTCQGKLPAPARRPRLVSLSGMSSITRLEADDLTCSVEPGISRAEFDAALAAKGVTLPCEASTGSLGGLFASGACGPFAPGAMSPRSLLLGMECLLAEGLAFKAGARVVKNVAGYDLPKLYVGSRGQLFIATLLHLKLRPAPRHRCCFRGEGLDHDQALALYSRLRLLSPAPSSLLLRKTRHGLSVEGRREGRSQTSAQLPPGENLCEVESLQPAELFLDGPGHEILAGTVRPSRLGDLLALLAAEAEFVCNGSGQFEVKTNPQQSDTMLRRIVELDGHAEIRLGSADRRGQATATDSGHQSISSGLKRALDPKGILQ